jgi:hypothetical protein
MLKQGDGGMLYGGLKMAMLSNQVRTTTVALAWPGPPMAASTMVAGQRFHSLESTQLVEGRHLFFLTSSSRQFYQYLPSKNV